MSITGPRPAICESNARTLAEGWVSPLCGTRAAIVEDIECIGRPMADFSMRLLIGSEVAASAMTP